MTHRQVSVVVVSRGRPTALARCLMGLAQLYYDPFEVVVVACPAGLAALVRDGWGTRIKTVAYDEANISQARNLGIAQAAGEIVAFIDDDAVPEPTWLTRLLVAFDTPDVAAAGGFVRGRNGISYQWKGRVALADATTRPLPVPEDSVTVHQGAPGRAAKTEGTNMAVRRHTLARIGGFDPVYRFYLDETDLNLRLGAAGARTAIVPMAQVHHGFAASDRRRDDRVPLSLFEIGASLAAFLRRHGGEGQDARLLRDAERASQRVRLLGHMVAGRLEPRDVTRLLAGFDAGWADGAARPLDALPAIADPAREFLPLATATAAHTVLTGRSRDAAKVLASAAEAVASGHRVSVFLLSPGTRRHSVRFEVPGVWVQRGGILGASDRTDPAVRLWRFGARCDRETARVLHFRKISHI